MQNPLLQTEVITALGIGDLSENDQLVFLSKHGDIIFDTALNRFDALLSSPDQQQLREYLATDPEPDVLVHYLLGKYEQFAVVLHAVAEEIKNETKGIE